MPNSKSPDRIMVCPETSKFWFVDSPELIESLESHIKKGNCIIGYLSDGSIHWYKNKVHHRDNGPALEDSHGFKYWYKNDKLHRETGPAVEYPDGTKYWYLDGEQISEKEFKEIDYKP